MTDKTTNPAKTPAAAESPSNSAVPKKKGASRFVTPILVLVLVAAAGIFGGVFIGQATATSSAATTRGGFTGGGQGGTGQAGGGTFAGGGFTSGTVTTNDDGTLTVTTAAGDTVTVTTGDDTTVTTTSEGAVSDLAEGDTVTIVGETDDDGNVTATTITEGATGFGGGGFPGGTAPTGAPSDN